MSPIVIADHYPDDLPVDLVFGSTSRHAQYTVGDFRRLLKLEAQVAQLRAGGQRLRNQAQAVVKAWWALSDVGPFLPDTANGRAFGEVLDALEICLRATAGNAP